MLRRLFSWMKVSRTPAPSAALGRIEMMPDGFRKLALDAPDQFFSVKWSDVREIVTWKDDLFTVDLINLGFRVGEADEYVAVNEEEEGWRVLTDRLPELFPAMARDWYTVVMHPPFARCWTTVWGEPRPGNEARIRHR
jgi:hypothetical protein